eukprot:scaffold305409_cov18-Prasinocladus_malaysianus.AAC.1
MNARAILVLRRLSPTTPRAAQLAVERKNIKKPALMAFNLDGYWPPFWWMACQESHHRFSY